VFCKKLAPDGSGLLESLIGAIFLPWQFSFLIPSIIYFFSSLCVMRNSWGTPNLISTVSNKIFSMLKLTLFLLSILSSLAVFGQVDKNYENMSIDTLRKLWLDTSLYFPQTKFAKVVGYTFNSGISEEGNGEEFSIYDEKKNKFAKSINPSHIVLSKSQTDTLIKILNDTATFSWCMSGCFFPHHAFVFYNSKNKPVAYFNICFMCHQKSAMPSTPIMIAGGIPGDGWTRLHDFCKSIGLPIHPEIK